MISLRKIENNLRRKIPKEGFLFRVLKTINLFISPIRTKIHSIPRKLSKNSIFNKEEELSMCSLFPQKTLDEVIKTIQPKSVLDLGCGVGKSLDFFLENGIDSVGVEGSSLAIKQAINRKRIIELDLNNAFNLERKFDLIWSFEFIEHIHPKYLNNLMDSIAKHSSKVILSAARPGQGGEGHFNEQNDEYWIKKFNEYGFALDLPITTKLRSIDEIYSSNMYCFKKS